MSQFPDILRVRQKFDGPCLQNVTSEIERQLDKLELRNRIQTGETVAITAGSRGIANIVEILQAVIGHLHRLGARPFVIPAMGSHGGGTTDGQLRVLRGYGITEEAVGCPIRASMQTVVVCQAKEGFPVYFDQHAYQADHVLVCGRVKPHTDFTGPIQSGLMKMLLLGLGKHDGAKTYHRAFHDFSFDQIVRSVANHVLQKCKIVGGLATIENAYEQTAHIEGVLPTDFESREPELLKMADRWLARLPFDEADVLIVDEIGKNISGTGMDTNVIGRKHDDHRAADHETPKIKRIAVRGLTAETHGNASGIGIAEFALSRVAEQIDAVVTAENCVTSGHVSAGMMPLLFADDAAMLRAAMRTVGFRSAADTELIWIRNTLDLAEFHCSTAYAAAIEANPSLTVIATASPLPLSRDGFLPG